jgi:DNA-binding GntR family transcriptional regulator
MSTTRAKARKNARPEVVYHKLRELIVRGQLAPGARIVETDVASRLGVSRTPVRGALQRLNQEGYIVESPRLQQLRPMVAPLTREDAKERDGLVKQLTAINDDFHRAAQARRQDHNKLWELDENFHRCYVEAGAGPRLIALHDAVKPQAERYERLYVSLLARDLATSVTEHRTIVRAIKSGNPDAAQGAVQTNWRNAAARLGSVIESVGERGSW